MTCGMKFMRLSWGRIVRNLTAVVIVVLGVGVHRGNAQDADVLPEYDNAIVTRLTEDCESVRLGLGAAWAELLDARAMSLYLKPWADQDHRAGVEKLLQRGVAMYELLKCVDDGILSVRFSRDTRDNPNLSNEVLFWRNELALAAGQVSTYCDEALATTKQLRDALNDAGVSKGLSAKNIDPIPWENAEREAWRKAGPRVLIRVASDPDKQAPVAVWNQMMSVGPGYIVKKFITAGDEIFTTEAPVGAWGYNASEVGKHDWSRLNASVKLFKDRGGKFLLEIPTLQANQTPEQQEKQNQQWRGGAWIWDQYAPALPQSVAQQKGWALESRNVDGSTQAFGGVNLFNDATAKAFGEYVLAMAENLKSEGLYDSISAVHLERGDFAILPDEVDYSQETQRRWIEHLKKKFEGKIDALNAAVGKTYPSWEMIPIPPMEVDVRAGEDWKIFLQTSPELSNANAWGNFLMQKYASNAGIRAALGTDYRDGYGWRMPIAPQGAIGIEWMHFRRVWVRDYLQIKRDLIAKAFPDKLLIAEMRQMGDHDEIAQTAERKWGGFVGDDFAVWGGVGPASETQPFMIRSVGPPGFGTRPSDAIESLFRDYLWINYRDPGNMARYFYAWTNHGYLDYQHAWHSITNHWQTNRQIYSLGPTVANTQPRRESIGMLMPRATLDLGDRSIYDGYLGWNWMLYAAKLPYTRVDEWRVKAGELSKLNLSILILPDVRAMDANTASEIREWVQAGGTLVCSRVPGETDEYGNKLEKSLLADVLQTSVTGTTEESVANTPLNRTVSHGVWPDYRDPREPYQVLAESGKVLASYERAGPAIVQANFGKGKAITMGYEFGRECVIADRTSVAFNRIYTMSVREEQLVPRTQWLRKFFIETLEYKPEFAVEFADVARWKEKESRAMGLNAPRGMSEDPKDFFFIRTFGDPRPDHEVEIDRESIDMGFRFFPRVRNGVATTYLGLSTRETHYIAPRGTVNIVLAPRVYRLRINNPKIQCIWDVQRNVPVGFARDDDGVTFDVSLPSATIMMLAISETPTVELFAPADFPGLSNTDAIAQAKALAGGEAAPAYVDLTPARIKPWLEKLSRPVDAKLTYTEAGQKEKVLISYGSPEYKPAAERLASGLKEKFAIDAEAIEQAAVVKKTEQGDQTVTDFDRVLIFIGNEWSNNDLALHTSYWNFGNHFGGHIPFTSSYNWPGAGRAVVSLSRSYALTNASGRQVEGGVWNPTDVMIRKTEDRFPIVRQKLHIGVSTPAAADAAVEAMLQSVR